MMKIWYLLIEHPGDIPDSEEGPYSVEDLRRHPWLTPYTFVRKEGQRGWKPAHTWPELEEIFIDPVEGQPLHDSKKKPSNGKRDDTGLVLAMRHDPPSFYFWLLIATILLTYALYQLSHR